MQACEVVDKCLQELLDTVNEVNGRFIVTADHGNCDDMVQRTKKGEPIYDEGKPVPLTSHTLAPVGVAVGGKGLPESVKVRHHLLIDERW
jgi:2,3-bisphosphoglycerate-independent phosphoglycerate mutase